MRLVTQARITTLVAKVAGESSSSERLIKYAQWQVLQRVANIGLAASLAMHPQVEWLPFRVG